MFVCCLQAYLNAIQSNRAEGGDLRVALERSQGLELQKTSPRGRVVHQSTKTKKVVDTEDSQHLSELQQDGRILTETRKTTEHEEVLVLSAVVRVMIIISQRDLVCVMLGRNNLSVIIAL